MTLSKLIFITIFVMALSACSASQDAKVVPHKENSSKAEVIKDVSTTVLADDHLEITLIDELDGILNSFCFDIAGGNKDADVSRGLQAHTCYSYKGSLGADQIFSREGLASDILYMPVYDVCATLESLEAGAKVDLAACDGSELQQITFTNMNEFIPVVAPDMCLTVAQDTRFGKGSQHQIKDLTLELCNDSLASYQQWRTRVTDD